MPVLRPSRDVSVTASGNRRLTEGAFHAGALAVFKAFELAPVPMVIKPGRTSGAEFRRRGHARIVVRSATLEAPELMQRGMGAHEAGHALEPSWPHDTPAVSWCAQAIIALGLLLALLGPEWRSPALTCAATLTMCASAMMVLFAGLARQRRNEHRADQRAAEAVGAEAVIAMITEPRSRLSAIARACLLWPCELVYLSDHPRPRSRVAVLTGQPAKRLSR